MRALLQTIPLLAFERPAAVAGKGERAFTAPSKLKLGVRRLQFTERRMLVAGARPAAIAVSLVAGSPGYCFLSPSPLLTGETGLDTTVIHTVMTALCKAASDGGEESTRKLGDTQKRTNTICLQAGARLLFVVFVRMEMLDECHSLV